MIDYRAILRESGIDPASLPAREFIAITNAMARVHTAAHNAGYAYAIADGEE